MQSPPLRYPPTFFHLQLPSVAIKILRPFYACQEKLRVDKRVERQICPVYETQRGFKRRENLWKEILFDHFMIYERYFVYQRLFLNVKSSHFIYNIYQSELYPHFLFIIYFFNLSSLIKILNFEKSFDKKLDKGVS